MARQNSRVHLGGGRGQRANGRLKVKQKNERGAPTLKDFWSLHRLDLTEKLSLHSLGAQSGQLLHLFLTFSSTLLAASIAVIRPRHGAPILLP